MSEIIPDEKGYVLDKLLEAIATRNIALQDLVKEVEFLRVVEHAFIEQEYWDDLMKKLDKIKKLYE